MRRRLTLVAFALVASLLATPLAQAALDGLRVSASPENATAYPGETVKVRVNVSNDALVGDTPISMNVTALPAGWLWDFAPASFTVPPGSNASTTLSLFVPASAAPQNATIVYEARATDTLGRFARGTVNVTVLARPAPSVDPPAEPRAPAITLAASTGDSATSGANATGSITLRHDDAARERLTLKLAVAPGAPEGWSAFIRESDQNRVLRYQQSAVVPISVLVPPLKEDTSATFPVTVTVVETGNVFTVRWTVLGLATAAPPSGQSQAPNASEPAQSKPTPTPTQRVPTSGPNLEILVEPLELSIASGDSATATVKLHNSGSVPLDLRVLATQPASWRSPDLDPRELTLAPGARTEVAMTLHAPEGIPTGGSAVVPVTVVGPSSLTRRAELMVRIVEPSVPRDDTTSAAATTAPVPPPDASLPVASPAMIVAVSLGTAGAGALVLLNRPLREKLLWGAAGLYTRLARPDVLGHEDREKLYRLVESQPGIHFHALQRDLGWNTGTLTYHVRVLERHGFVVSRRDGLYRRFYLSGAAPRKEVFENAGPSGLRADVLDAIRNTPGISQSDLALGLGANKQTVNYHVKALERAGTIRIEKRGRDTFLFPGGAAASPDVDAAQA